MSTIPFEALYNFVENGATIDLNSVLEPLHTKQLLKVLRYWSQYTSHAYYDHMNFYDGTDDIVRPRVILLENKVKAILSTREHIPNKKESKKLRQEAAKRKT